MVMPATRTSGGVPRSGFRYRDFKPQGVYMAYEVQDFGAFHCPRLRQTAKGLRMF